MPPKSSEPDKYSKELEFAVRTVHMACLVCEKVQESLGPEVNDQAQCKGDYCPAKIAGNLISYPFLVSQLHLLLTLKIFTWISLIHRSI